MLCVPPTPPSTRLSPLGEGLLGRGKHRLLLSLEHLPPLGEGQQRGHGGLGSLIYPFPAVIGVCGSPRAAALGFTPLQGGAQGCPGAASPGLRTPGAALEQEGQTPGLQEPGERLPRGCRRQTFGEPRPASMSDDTRAPRAQTAGPRPPQGLSSWAAGHPPPPAPSLHSAGGRLAANRLESRLTQPNRCKVHHPCNLITGNFQGAGSSGLS